ncbi:hypothetical protein HPB50_020714 [Hyalomma asiaticum]|uniref:Uncharacterized protein n=1 Tax=Hyalomma asiaticum TaxID=266040 RepID=A0ACB7TKT7_HYAAI|nr:hypothetical protein HPB50_020714 [Hyalomma asiaticum]
MPEVQEHRPHTPTLSCLSPPTFRLRRDTLRVFIPHVGNRDYTCEEWIVAEHMLDKADSEETARVTGSNVTTMKLGPCRADGPGIISKKMDEILPPNGGALTTTGAGATKSRIGIDKFHRHRAGGRVAGFADSDFACEHTMGEADERDVAVEKNVTTPAKELASTWSEKSSSSGGNSAKENPSKREAPVVTTANTLPTPGPGKSQRTKHYRPRPLRAWKKRWKSPPALP